ncbi:MAG: restriction endonuclease [Sphaerobacter sp.]|nr:restriction endonuclease [Sphaerobacter sp.]
MSMYGVLKWVFKGTMYGAATVAAIAGAWPVAAVFGAAGVFSFRKKREKPSPAPAQAPPAAPAEEPVPASADDTLAWIDSLTPDEFEAFWCSLIPCAERVGGPRDMGADILQRDPATGEVEAVWQCKHYGPQHPVGPKAVMEVHAARTYYRAQDAYVVTTGDFTPAARELADECEVVLMHRGTIRAMLERRQEVPIFLPKRARTRASEAGRIATDQFPR